MNVLGKRSKMEELLNHKITRIIGTVIGFPASIFGGYVCISGLVIGFSGIVEYSLWHIVVGIMTITSIIAAIGIWARLLNPTNNMTLQIASRIRASLFIGLGTVLYWLVMAIPNKDLFILVFLSFILFVIVAFLYGTPKNPNKD